MLKSKGKIQVGIYLISILMMGVVGIASAISVIGANFPELSQTDVQTLISIPCIIIIPVTLVMGIGFFMMMRANVVVPSVILAIVWVCHIIYFVFGVKTIRKGQSGEKASAEEKSTSI